MTTSTIKFTFNANTGRENGYFKHTDPDQWDVMEKAIGNITTAHQKLWDTKGSFTLQVMDYAGIGGTLPKPIAKRLNKYCSEVELSLYPFSNGNIYVATTFKAKKPNAYNNEQLQDCVRYIRDMGLGLPSQMPHVLVDTVGEDELVIKPVPHYTSVISEREGAFQLCFFPQGGTINGQDLSEDGEWEFRNGKATRVGDHKETTL